jgi:hypothetical protein
MPRRISTTDEFLKYAISLARNNNYKKALLIVLKN